MHEATMTAVEEKLTSIASSDSSPATIKETHFEKLTSIAFVLVLFIT